MALSVVFFDTSVMVFVSVLSGFLVVLEEVFPSLSNGFFSSEMSGFVLIFFLQVGVKSASLVSETFFTTSIEVIFVSASALSDVVTLILTLTVSKAFSDGLPLGSSGSSAALFSTGR